MPELLPGFSQFTWSSCCFHQIALTRYLSVLYVLHCGIAEDEIARRTPAILLPDACDAIAGSIEYHDAPSAIDGI